VAEPVSWGRADEFARADVNAVAIADQFIAMTSYSALIGQPLSEERVEKTEVRLPQGVAT
jgi:hypothetical protein